MFHSIAIIKLSTMLVSYLILYLCPCKDLPILSNIN